EKGIGMYRKAVELAETHGWFLARQFETEANAEIHESTTAREIINDFAGRRLDVFVTGYGTVAPSRASRVCSGASGPRPVSCCANLPTPNWSGAASHSSAPPTGHRPAAIRHGSRIQSRAGR